LSTSPTASAERQVGFLAVVGVSARAGSQAMTLVLLILAGRFLTVEVFGIFVLASIVMSFALAHLYTGIYHYVLREPAYDETKPTACTLAILFSLAFSLLIVAVAGLSYWANWGNLLSDLILATALIPILGMFGSWHEAQVLRKGDVVYYYVCVFVSELIGFCLAVYLLLNNFGVWSLIANRYLTAFIYPLLLRFRSEPLPRLGWNSDAVRSIFSYSLGMYGNASLSFFSSYGAAIIMGGLMSASVVGIYRMATRTAIAAFDVFAQTFRTFVWQALGRLAREERSSAELWIRLLAVFASITLFLLGSLSILARDITELLLGEKWLEMVQPMQIICFVYPITAAAQLAAAQLGAAGRTSFLFKARLIEVIVLLAAVLIAAPFGLIAICISLFPPVILFNLITYRQLIKNTGTNLQEVVKGVLPGIIGAFAALGVVYATAQALEAQVAWLRISITASTGLVTFLVIAAIPLRRWTRKTLEVASVAILPRSNAVESGSS